ncbi:MAG: repair protein RecO [Bacteroidetes bacterium]|nr:repair protein RecO [Bacteroidota bacterium]
MLHKTSGIVLHTTKYSESSLIVKLYTQDFGMQSYMINGVRNKKSKNKASLFQPLALVDLIITGNEKSGLQRISDITLHLPYEEIPYNIVKSSIALFLNEILLKSLREQHPDEDLFLFLKNSLRILDLHHDNCANFHISFMLQLSRYLGFYPQGKHTDNTSVMDLQEGKFVNYLPHHPHYLNSKQSTFLSQFLNIGYESFFKVKIDKSERKQLLHALILFYQLHVSSFGVIKSLEVLEEVAG